MDWIHQSSKDIFEEKYTNGNETFQQVCERIAVDISGVEKTPELQEKFYTEFLSIMLNRSFIPAGRIWRNSGSGELSSNNYNNCFTIGLEDSMNGIFDALKEDALIGKAGGGVGFDISTLRPKGESIKAGGYSSGPLSFLEIFDSSAKSIMTGGQRRGAHIALMDISHPDIESFITCKHGDKNKRFTQFNISVKITDKFMIAVKNDKDFELKWGGKVFKTVKARDLFDLIAKNAFEHNEPGMFFVDAVNHYNNGYWAFEINEVNPCGEICMPKYNLCCLSHINFTSFVNNPFTKDATFNLGHLGRTVKLGIRFLDNVLDRTGYPLQKIKDNSLQWRRIGLGFTGLADMMAMMTTKYGSKESIELTMNIMKEFRNSSYTASIELAKEKGRFPAYDEKILKSNFIGTLPSSIIQKIKKYGLRNIGLNTVAPTGTTSLTIGNNCSSGIEPVFALEYERRIRGEGVEDYTKETFRDYAWHLYCQTTHHTGKRPDYFVTVEEINPEDQIKVQAVVQKFIDHSISKTLNLPQNSSYDDYKKLLFQAYDADLKGFTSFNPSGSMKGILLTKKEEEKSKEKFYVRPKVLEASSYVVNVQDKSYLILVGEKEKKPYEIFLLDNTKGDERLYENLHNLKGKILKVKPQYYNYISEDESEIYIDNITSLFYTDRAENTLSRLLSLCLRHEVPLQILVEQIEKNKSFMTLEKSINRILRKYIKSEKYYKNEICSICDSENIWYIEGCKICKDCGNAVCG